MDKYNNNGKLLKQMKQDEYCEVCRNGDKFITSNPRIKTDIFGSDYDIVNCIKCGSCYKIPRLIPMFDINTKKPMCIYADDIKKFDDTQELTPDNEVMFELKYDMICRNEVEKISYAYSFHRHYNIYPLYGCHAWRWLLLSEKK